MKTTKAFKYLFYLFLSVTLMSTFNWSPGSEVNFIYLFYIFIILLAIQKNKMNATIFKVTLLGFTIHLFSFVLSFTLYKLPINWSWFLQGSILIFLIPSGKIITENKGFIDIFSKSMKHFAWIAIIAGVWGIVEGFKNYGTIWLLSGYDQRLTYQFLASSDVGLIKQLYPYVLNLFLIFGWNQFNKPQRIILIGIDIVLLLLMGSRTIAFALFMTMGIVLVKTRINNKKIKTCLFVLVPIAIAVLSSLFKQDIYELTTKSGRFYFQIFSSKPFWLRPFGVGLGNYTLSIVEGLWDNINTDSFSQNTIINLTQNTDFSARLTLFPIAESDLILIGGEYGWLGLFLWISVAAQLIKRFIIKKSIDCELTKLGYLTFIFIFFSGFLNDYLSYPPTWLFLSISINLIQTKQLNVTKNISSSIVL